MKAVRPPVVGNSTVSGAESRPASICTRRRGHASAPTAPAPPDKPRSADRCVSDVRRRSIAPAARRTSSSEDFRSAFHGQAPGAAAVGTPAAAWTAIGVEEEPRRVATSGLPSAAAPTETAPAHRGQQGGAAASGVCQTTRRMLLNSEGGRRRPRAPCTVGERGVRRELDALDRRPIESHVQHAEPAAARAGPAIDAEQAPPPREEGHG